MPLKLLFASYEYSLEGSRLRIGRADHVDVSISGDPLVSSQHCVIQNGKLTDAQSTNGTMINKQKVAYQTPHQLKSGDIITVGETNLFVEEGIPYQDSNGNPLPVPSHNNHHYHQQILPVSSTGSSNSRHSSRGFGNSSSSASNNGISYSYDSQGIGGIDNPAFTSYSYSNSLSSASEADGDGDSDSSFHALFPTSPSSHPPHHHPLQPNGADDLSSTVHSTEEWDAALHQAAQKLADESSGSSGEEDPALTTVEGATRLRRSREKKQQQQQQGSTTALPVDDASLTQLSAPPTNGRPQSTPSTMRPPIHAGGANTAQTGAGGLLSHTAIHPLQEENWNLKQALTKSELRLLTMEKKLNHFQKKGNNSNLLLHQKQKLSKLENQIHNLEYQLFYGDTMKDKENEVLQGRIKQFESSQKATASGVGQIGTESSLTKYVSELASVLRASIAYNDRLLIERANHIMQATATASPSPSTPAVVASPTVETPQQQPAAAVAPNVMWKDAAWSYDDFHKCAEMILTNAGVEVPIMPALPVAAMSGSLAKLKTATIKRQLSHLMTDSASASNQLLTPQAGNAAATATPSAFHIDLSSPSPLPLSDSAASHVPFHSPLSGGNGNNTGASPTPSPVTASTFATLTTLPQSLSQIQTALEKLRVAVEVQQQATPSTATKSTDSEPSLLTAHLAKFDSLSSQLQSLEKRLTTALNSGLATLAPSTSSATFTSADAKHLSSIDLQLTTLIGGQNDMQTALATMLEQQHKQQSEARKQQAAAAALAATSPKSASVLSPPSPSASAVSSSSGAAASALLQADLSEKSRRVAELEAALLAERGVAAQLTAIAATQADATKKANETAAIAAAATKQLTLNAGSAPSTTANATAPNAASTPAALMEIKAVHTAVDGVHRRMNQLVAVGSAAFAITLALAFTAFRS